MCMNSIRHAPEQVLSLHLLIAPKVQNSSDNSSLEAVDEVNLPYARPQCWSIEKLGPEVPCKEHMGECTWVCVCVCNRVRK